MAYQSKTNKSKKFSISLSHMETEVLGQYAKDHKISRPEAIRRLLKESLQPYMAKKAKEDPENQLGLFDTLQIDIFNNHTKI